MITNVSLQFDGLWATHSVHTKCFHLNVIMDIDICARHTDTNATHATVYVHCTKTRIYITNTNVTAIVWRMWSCFIIFTIFIRRKSFFRLARLLVINRHKLNEFWEAHTMSSSRQTTPSRHIYPHTHSLALTGANTNTQAIELYFYIVSRRIANSKSTNATLSSQYIQNSSYPYIHKQTRFVHTFRCRGTHIRAFYHIMRVYMKHTRRKGEKKEKHRNVYGKSTMEKQQIQQFSDDWHTLFECAKNKHLFIRHDDDTKIETQFLPYFMDF